ncbi:MAG: hypothetical protein HY986_16855 [Candidatus Melainabacteria bacterium]|nr:hypothetical protein [Candidatus Melainabacteria bacterium]
MSIRAFLTGWLTAFIVLLCPAKAQSKEELVLTDRSQGCTDSKSLVTTFNKVGDNYIEANKNGKGRVLSRKQLLDLLTAIEEAKSQSTFNPESLGITPQSVNLHTIIMQKAACHQSNSDYSKALQKRKEAFQYPAVVEAARLKMSFRDCGTQHVQYKLVIKDPSLHAETIEVSSSHECPWMLPWTIRTGDTKCSTYSTTLPLKLKALDPCVKGPNQNLLDGAKYWQQDFWSDRLLWSYQVGFQLDQALGIELLEALPGALTVGKNYTVTKCSFAADLSKPHFLLAELAPVDRGAIDCLLWQNQINRGQPVFTWEQLHDKFKLCQAAVKEHPWLEEWRKSNSENQIVCTVTGQSCVLEPGKNIDEFILPAWRDARLSGKPEIEVTLRRGRFTCGIIYLSPLEKKSLVVLAMPQAGGKHWFDQEKLSFHPRNPSYMLVLADGTKERRAMNPLSPSLPQWARQDNKKYGIEKDDY